MAGKDYYKILGVDKKADSSAIKKAYRKLAHKYHPDKDSGDENKFKEISEAYAVLGDDKKRAEYDTYGQTFNGFGGGSGYGGFSGRAGSASDFDFSGFQSAHGQQFHFDLNDLFSEFFGGQYSRVPKGRDISVDIQVTFHESIFGTTKEILIPMPVHRDGKIIREQQAVELKIPAGINNGEMLRINGKGEVIPNGNPGDLYIKVHVTPSRKFRKEGVHLLADLDVKLSDALLGFEYKFETLEGTIKVIIPKGVNHGELLRLKGKGVPMPNGQRGDLLLRVQIKMPTKLSRKAKKLIEELREQGL